ncbi:MAG: ATP-binding protein [Hydrococcus sp. CRU_1_1]|nr:ATP-binding protein [Hydrococcus sp. CRU_1_1]
MLAQKVAQKFRLPLISRDDIKESLFDSLGWRDREWSKQLGIASYRLLYYFIESQVSAGNSSIAESNFMPKFDNLKFLELKRKYKLYLLHIHCRADREVLFQRFKMRSESGDKTSRSCGSPQL